MYSKKTLLLTGILSGRNFELFNLSQVEYMFVATQLSLEQTYALQVISS